MAFVVFIWKPVGIAFTDVYDSGKIALFCLTEDKLPLIWNWTKKNWPRRTATDPFTLDFEGRLKKDWGACFFFFHHWFFLAFWKPTAKALKVFFCVCVYVCLSIILFLLSCLPVLWIMADVGFPLWDVSCAAAGTDGRWQGLVQYFLP